MSSTLICSNSANEQISWKEGRLTLTTLPKEGKQSCLVELYDSFHEIFSTILDTNCMDSTDMNIRYNVCLRLSRQYRSELMAFIERNIVLLHEPKHKDVLETTLLLSKGLTVEDFENILEDLHTQHSLWYLFEMQHFENTSNITSQYRDFCQRLIAPSEYLQDFQQAYNVHTKTYELPYGKEIDGKDYWMAVFNLLTVGRITSVLTLLDANSYFKTDYPHIFHGIVDALAMCPSLQYAIDWEEVQHIVKKPSHASLEYQWDLYKRKISTLLVEAEKINMPAIFLELLQLLAGNNVTILDTVCSSWMEKVCYYILYVDPALPKEKLITVVESFRDDAEMNAFDDAILTILSQPFDVALYTLSHILHISVSTHMIDLTCRLYQREIDLVNIYLSEADQHADFANVEDNKVVSEDGISVGYTRLFHDPCHYKDLRQYFLFKYATELQGQRLYTLCTNYYASCPSQWLFALNNMVLHQHIATSTELELVLAMCVKLRLTQAYQVLCARESRKFLRDGLTCRYVYWVLRSGDNFKANEITDDIITQSFHPDKDIATKARTMAQTLVDFLLPYISMDGEEASHQYSVNICEMNLCATAPNTVILLLHMVEAFKLHKQLLKNTTYEIACHALTAYSTAMKLAPPRIARMLSLLLACIQIIVSEAGITRPIATTENIMMAIHALENSVCSLAGHMYATVPNSIVKHLLPNQPLPEQQRVLPLGASVSDVFINMSVDETSINTTIAIESEAVARQLLTSMLINSMKDYQ